MTYQYKQNNVRFKVTLLLCTCCVVYGNTPPLEPMPSWNDNAPIVEEVVLQTITVYMGLYSVVSCCADTLIIENINLRVGRRDCRISPIGYGDAARSMRILLPDTNSVLHFVSPRTCCRPDNRPIWGKGKDLYPTDVDSTSWEKLMNIITSFEEGPSSCLRDCWP